MPASGDSLLLREVARQAPFRICRGLADGAPTLVWCLRRPGLEPRSAEAPYTRLVGKDLPGVATFLGTSWSRGEYRVTVAAPEAEQWLAGWLAGQRSRAERLLVARGLAAAVAALHAAGVAHGALGEDSFMVDTAGRAVLVDWPARPIYRIAQGAQAAPGRGTARAHDALALGLLASQVLTGRQPRPAPDGGYGVPPEVRPGVRGALASLLGSDPRAASGAVATLAGRLEALAEAEGESERTLATTGEALVRLLSKWSRLVFAGVMLWAALELVRLLALFPLVRTVPQVVGLPQRTALPRLRALGLRAEVVGHEGGGGVVKDAVVRTDPVAGRTVRGGAVVRVWVSSGAERLVVPGVAGLSAAAATRRLLAAGLWVGRVGVSETSLAVSGTVVATVPGVGQGAVVGQAVELLVSVPEGEGLALVPDFAGGTVAAALAVMREAGVAVGGAVRVVRRQRAVSRGGVATQSPRAGDWIPAAWPGDLLLVVETARDSGQDWNFLPGEMPGWVRRGNLQVTLLSGEEVTGWDEPWDRGIRRPAFLVPARAALDDGKRPVVLTISQEGRVAWTTTFE